ncbi:hypothetical protein [Mobilicoccus caccae]|uniref:Acylphosphatase n=1 Tax=Mobilicoccus caccae TaxID=1859295 RepID=A0ABQ6IM38_9MICO|nr:hypothetical protein [Mobilicoccus caccae]GMA38415.1 hypothetical protein GCM10025883_04600 [Mobilicoccus caccae]
MRGGQRRCRAALGAGPPRGGRPCWLREIHDPDVIEAVAGWLEAGGPGLADEPDLVAIHAFTPSRRIRTEHEDT